MPPRPALLELNFEKSWRGGERQTIYNTIGFREAGLHVHLLCRKNTPLHQAAMQKSIPVHAFRNIFGVIFFLIFKGHCFTIFHAQTSHILTYCVFTRPFHRAQIVFTRRVDFVPKGKLTLLKYRLTHHIVAISEAVKKILETFTQKDVALISDAAVSQTLNKARARKWLSEEKIPENSFVLGTTAAFVPHKDPLNMVEAIRELAQLRSDFIFLHFGDGPLEEAAQAKIESYGLEAHYRMMGFKNNVEDIFSVLDVFAMSSYEEGLGSSVLDAFLYGVPVAATNAGGLPDLLQKGRGVLCNTKDPKGLAQAINTLLNNPDFRKQTAAAAYEYVHEYHSISYISNQYLSLLKLI